MPQSDIGVGGLPFPQFDYPINITNVPYTVGTNRIALGPAQAFYVPRGKWQLSVTGVISALQWFDPVRLEWVNLLGPGAAWQTEYFSDGVNYRVFNLSDSWYTGIVTAAGTGYVQGSTTVTAGTGNSTWQPIVGGKLGTFTTNTGTGFFAGTGFTKPPIVAIGAPPAPGIAATATCSLSSGAVGTVSIGAQAGAGYLTAPPVYLFPDQTDPAWLAGAANLWYPNPGLVTVALTGAGTLTGLLLVNAGQLLTTAPTLTVNGIGSSATATTSPASVVAAATDTLTIQPC